VKHGIYRYLDCGFLHNGFARVRCKDCGHEYLVAFSCKRRHFCPSCHQKRLVEFSEWLCEEVLKAARYLIRASFSQERMTYIPDESKVIYRSKDGKNEKDFDALEWLAAMCSHVPNRGEQRVRYYGHYSNVSRG